MQHTGSTKTLPIALMAAVVLGGLVFIACLAAFSMAAGHWGVGGWGMRGHMQGMMGGGTNSSNAPLSVGTKAESIEIRNFAFAPGNLQVPAGATVTWTNYDDAPHSATAKDGSWDTGLLNKGEKKSVTFDRPGEYDYYCKVHPNMIARLTVQ